MAVGVDHLMSSLSVHRRSFEQQIHDAETLIDEAAEQLSTAIDNERQRLLAETAAIHRNTVTELDKVYKNSSGDEMANVNFYAVRPQATRIR